jgi:hypothetical protein
MRASPGLEKHLPLARTIFAVTVLLIGGIYLVFGEAVTRLMQAWPEGFPGRPYWAHVVGGLLALLAVLALAGWRSRLAWTALGTTVVIVVACLSLPRALRSGEFGDAWLNVCKWLTFASANFLMADTLPAGDGPAWTEKWIRLWARLARWWFAAFMIGAAYLHLRFPRPIAEHFIPAWIPWRVFWVYFTAGALTAGGIGLLIPPVARLAALLSGLMILLFSPLVHLPLALRDPRNPGEWSGVIECVAFAAFAFVLAINSGRTRKGEFETADQRSEDEVQSGSRSGAVAEQP